MTLATIQNAFIAGEMSPSLFGRTDLKKYHEGASTMRNFFANYRGGAASRAGTAYVGTCKQPATAAPPRLIPFQFNINQGYALEFGDQYMRIITDGAYIVEAANAITAITKANPGVFTYTNTNYTLSNGDWIYITGVGGMNNFNNLVWIVAGVSGSNFHVTDLFGNPVNTSLFSAYTSGGSLQRIYTVVSPYAAVDLPYLKFTQSADTMSMTCVNQLTGTEYPPYDLVRNGNTNWVFTKTSFAANISPPASITVVAQNSTTVSTWYSYVVTAVNAQTGEESVASPAGSVENNDISVFAGSNTITWSTVTGAGSYNIYKAIPSYTVPVAVGSSYGFVGSAFGNTFTDTNIIEDFTQVPPVHKDPFARGQILAVVPTAGGSGYSQGTIGYTITTSTGSGFIGAPVVVGDAFVAFIVENNGSGYVVGDTIEITGGSGATATLTVGPETGTYPGVVAYYQERRAYANTQNNPDTYFFSQPGAFKNMDSSIPTTDSDAIVGAPWAQQINGIQFMQPMPSGLIMLTGNGAWLLNGGNSAALTPASQTVTTEAYNGCNAYVPPIIINYDILYVQSKGSIVRDLSYNFFVNIYTGDDKTILSNHLFNYFQIQQWAWAEEPYKVVWAVRNDGTMLSLTYLKEQDVYAWARHDTNGSYVSVCSITEPPVNAVYVVTKRYILGHNTYMYYTERMDNRNWQNPEDCFCVDAGLAYPLVFPNATLTPAAANGTANISTVNLISGGSGYTAPVVTAEDPTGEGTGATFSATVVSGVITGITVLSQGQNYQYGTTLQILDSTGSSAKAQPIITNNVLFTASSGVFSLGNVGNIIRIGNNNFNQVTSGNGIIVNGGGKAVVTSYVSSTQVMANIIQPITAVVPNDPNNMPVPAIPNQWSITAPVSVVTGLNHLEGMEVSILADGSVIPEQTVTNGTITLPQAYSSIAIGLPFTCQLQTLYMDAAAQVTIQGKRKNISSVIVRTENSRGFSVGSNQPDESTQPNEATVPWTNMIEVKERNALVTAGAAIPLFTGDTYINIPTSWDTNGQVAIQTVYPLPLNVSAVIYNYVVGDTSS